MIMKIEGMFSVLITPFFDDGSLNIEGFKQNLHFQLQHNVDGIVVLGTTGEAPTITEKEKELIIKTAREIVPDHTMLMVGTGYYSTQTTIHATKVAKDLGADAALIVTPYYNKPTQEGIYRHFQAITSNVDIPIMLYNHQGRTGQNIQTDTLKRIASLPNIVGVKEASGNITQMMDVIEQLRKVNPNFSVMSGDDMLTLSLMAHGGDGILSVISNLVPGMVKTLVDAAQVGDYTEARRIHFELLPLIRDAFIETNPIPIKYLMELHGMAAGPCRLPLCEPTPQNQAKLKALLNSLPYVRHDQTKSQHRQASCGVSVS